MRKVGLLYLAVLLLCCSYSNAYEAQYQVGGTGPNGGTITSVTVVPTLVDTQSEMVGDYLEYTYTYEYEETVQETVQQTTTTTSIVITEKTDQLIDTATQTNVNISTNCSWAGNVDFCTAGENQSGGSKTYTFDVSDYTNKKELDYGSSVTSHASNANVPLCSATNNDCKDEFKLTVRLINNGVVSQTYTHNYASMNWTGTQNYSFNQDVSALTFDTAKLELYGMDSGYYSGYFGPAFSNTFFNLTYDHLTEVINTIINNVTMTSILNTQEYVYDSEYIPPPPPIEVDYTDYTVDAGVTFEMELETFDGGMGTFEVEISETSTGEFDIAINEVEPMEIEIETDMAEPIEVAQAEPEPETQEVETVEAEGESNEPETDQTEVSENRPSENSEEVADETGGSDRNTAKKSKSNDKSKSNRRSAAIAYSTILETTRLIVMQQSQAVKLFDTYTQVSLPTMEFYPVYEIKGGENYDNPYGMWWMGASDVLMNDMVEMQWQN